MGGSLQLDVSKYLEELFEVYREIDTEYEKIASEYGFGCSGCEDNCCNTVFYHYTLIEYFALLEGFDNLPPETQKKSIERARDYVQQLNRYRMREEELKIMCPLNYDGLCSVYEHRPLICRVHGLPGMLQHPKKGKQLFSGCKRFEQQHKILEEKRIDRTPYYTQIATIETRLRQDMDYMLKFRKTVAEMILDRNLLSYRII